jgi:hypothetical protein
MVRMVAARLPALADTWLEWQCALLVDSRSAQRRERDARYGLHLKGSPRVGYGGYGRAPEVCEDGCDVVAATLGATQPLRLMQA